MSLPHLTWPLHCHPDTPCEALTGVVVRVSLDKAGLKLRYTLTGDMAQLRLPAPATPGPVDGLWRYTCCEAFVAGEGEAYREFNFSPSGQWAVYDFSAYRQRLENPAPMSMPAIGMIRGEGSMELTAQIPAALLPAGPLALGLSAVIETDAGRISCWALAHGPGKPDFHRRETFTLSLQP